MWVSEVPGEIWGKNIFEVIMAANFPNLVKDKFTDSESLENLQQGPCEKTVPRYVTIKLFKTKDNNKGLKKGRKKMRK